jgi:hypothetical protein
MDAGVASCLFAVWSARIVGTGWRALLPWKFCTAGARREQQARRPKGLRRRGVVLLLPLHFSNRAHRIAFVASPRIRLARASSGTAEAVARTRGLRRSPSDRRRASDRTARARVPARAVGRVLPAPALVSPARRGVGKGVSRRSGTSDRCDRIFRVPPCPPRRLRISSALRGPLAQLVEQETLNL